MRVLVVDDNPINLELMTILLEEQGFIVEPVEHAEQAMHRIRENPPDLLVADVQLPGMSGLDLLQRVRSEPETRDLCGVVVTSYAMSSDERKAYEAGCDGYIRKPIDTRTFGQQVADFAMRRRRSGANA
jgi:CheY-like chemotaxis protein